MKTAKSGTASLPTVYVVDDEESIRESLTN